MYNLDINFLNDRPEYSGSVSRTTRAPVSRGDAGGDRLDGMSPVLIGALVGFVPLALVLLGWGGLTFVKMQAEGERDEVSAQVAALEQQEKEREDIQKQLQSAEDRIGSLVSVFSNIKPWSALSQDLRDRLPPGVQITEIVQTTEAPKAAKAAKPAKDDQSAAAAAPAAPEPVGLVEISGYADTFDRVNDFLVVLQKSNFLTTESTRIVVAELMEQVQLAPVSLPGPDGQTSGGGSTGDLPKLPAKIAFKIETQLAQVPTDELLRELDRKGAVGLVSRIEALKEKGVIKP